MKKIILVMMLLAMLVGACACAAGGSQPITTESAADMMVEDALEEWMKTKIVSFDCKKFEYKITRTAKSSVSFASDAESGMRWYDAYGTVSFLDAYGDVLMAGNFKVCFGHDGAKSVAYINENTVVERTK